MTAKRFDYVQYIRADHPDGLRDGIRILRRLVRDAVRASENLEYMIYEGHDCYVDANRIARELVPSPSKRGRK